MVCEDTSGGGTKVECREPPGDLGGTADQKAGTNGIRNGIIRSDTTPRSERPGFLTSAGNDSGRCRTEGGNSQKVGGSAQVDLGAGDRPCASSMHQDGHVDRPERVMVKMYIVEAAINRRVIINIIKVFGHKYGSICT